MGIIKTTGKREEEKSGKTAAPAQLAPCTAA